MTHEDPQDEIRRLDGFIPESVDRRAFFKSAVGVTVSGLLAGCTGGSEGDSTEQQQTPPSTDSNDSTEASSDDDMVRNVTMRSAWKAEPNYAIGYASQLRGHWSDKGIGGVTYRKGFGSGDTAKRVGTGKEALGLGSISPQISGLAQDYDMQIFGTAKARSQLALLYRKDKISDPTGDGLADKTVVAESALNEQAWPVYVNAANVPDSTTLEFAEESGAVSLVSSGDADAIWGTIDDYGPFAESMDAEIGVMPLYNQSPSYGYTLIVNNEFLNGTDNFEFTKRVLEGYSEAGKWVLLNPEKAIDMMVNDVNQALSTQDRASLLDNMRAGVASTNMTEGVRDNGFAYLDKDVLSNSLSSLGEALDVDPPSADEVGAFDLQDEAELATFSKDEFKQVGDFADPYDEFFSK